MVTVGFSVVMEIVKLALTKEQILAGNAQYYLLTIY